MYAELGNWIKTNELQTPPLSELKFGKNLENAFDENNSKKQIFIF